MDVTYERDSAGLTTITVQVPAERVDETYQKALRELKRHVAVPGFRPGKVPPKMVESILGQGPILDYAKDLLRESVLPKALAERPELVALDDEEPELELGEFRRGEPCTLTARLTCAVAKLAEYKGLAVERYRAAVTDDEARDQLEREYRESAERVDSGHTIVAEGSEVEFALRIVRDGVLMEDFPPDEPLRVQLGDNDLNPNIDEHLLGLEVGEYKVFEVSYPDDFHNEELRGATAEFAVEVQRLTEREPLEMYLHRVGGYGSLEEATTGLRAALQARRAGTFRIMAREQAVRRLVEGSELDIPSARVEADVMDEIDEFEEALEARGIDLDTVEDQLEGEYARIRDRVTYDLRRSVALRALAQAEQIEVEREDIFYELSMLSQMNQVDPRLMIRRLEEDGQLPAIARAARLRKAAEQLLEWAEVTEVDAPETADEDEEVDMPEAALVEAAIGDDEDALDAADSRIDEPEDEPCP